MTKIAFLASGHSVHEYRFLHKMVERGYEPYLISFNHKTAPFQMEGVKYIHYYPRFHRLKTLAIALHLRKLLKQIKPDILHTGVIQSYGFYGALSGFHPTLLMPWGSDTLHTPGTSLIMRWITKYTIKRADMITCDAELLKKEMVRLTHYPEDRIVVFPWGVDLALFRPGPSSIRAKLGWEQNKVLIMTRTFYPIYGIEFFIEALPQVIKEEPQTRVILIGSGPLESHYRRRISQLGVEGYIHFAGHVEQSLMPQYLNAADVYVTTSLTDGTSLSLLEAMACGLPVVVSDAPTYLEWVEDEVNGYITPRGDSRQLALPIEEFLRRPDLWYSAMPWELGSSAGGQSPLADRLVHLLKSPELRQRMGKRNHEIAQERANWERNFDKLEGIYQTLVSRKKARAG